MRCCCLYILAYVQAMPYDTHVLIPNGASRNIDTGTSAGPNGGTVPDWICFVASRRLHTIRNTDRIPVTGHNDVVEQKPLENRMAKQGFYYELYAGQFG